jgi:hypothetical protein
MAYHATPEMAVRFWPQVQKAGPGECWNWQGVRNPAGYGTFYIAKVAGRCKRGMAHRIAYELTTGTRIPDEKQIDHLCKNVSCVNPSHLEVVTPRVNQMRSTSQAAKNAAKTHCLRNHELPAYRPGVRRRCSTCRSTQRRSRRAAA